MRSRGQVYKIESLKFDSLIDVANYGQSGMDDLFKINELEVKTWEYEIRRAFYFTVRMGF